MNIEVPPKEIIVQRNQYDNSKMPNLTIRAIRYIRADQP